MSRDPVPADRTAAGRVAAAGVAVVETLERRALFNVAVDGVHVGYETDLQRAVPLMRDLGITRVRIWNEVRSWDNLSENGTFKQARELKAAGFHVTLLIQNKTPPTYEQARRYYQFSLNAPGMKDAVDRWEIINEVNLYKYWEGTPQQYVNDCLKPAWDVFNAAGEPVVGASCTPDIRWVGLLRDAGYLNYVDFANTHPYTRTVGDMVRHISEVAAIYAGKPLVATEWNFKAPATFAQWHDLLAEAHPLVEQQLESIYYYRLIAKNETQAGPSGLILNTYVPHQPFYDLFKSWNSPITEPPGGGGIGGGTGGTIGSPASGSYVLSGPFGLVKVRQWVRYDDDDIFGQPTLEPDDPRNPGGGTEPIGGGTINPS